MIILIFLILGLIVGSFLNVVIYRLDLAESVVRGRSKCPHCEKSIRWYDNIPLFSFVLLRARCRDCGEKISWQYPLVEIVTGLLFAFIGARYFDPVDFVTWTRTAYFLGLFSFLIVIFVYDWRKMEIPGVALWPALGWTVAFNLLFDWQKIAPIGHVLDLTIYSGALAAFVGFLFFFLLVTVSKEKWMGLGDAHLVILLGLMLGWPQILLGLFLAFGLGAIFGIAMILLKKKKMQSQIPFAPFLILGAAIALFWYDALTGWYFGLF